MYLHNQLVFVAGGAGLAGSSIIQRLLLRYPRIRIRATVYKNTKPFIEDPRVDYFRCDLTSEADCLKAVKGCDCGFMAAAFTGGARFVNEFPLEHVKQNLFMNVQIMEAFYKQGIKRVVFVGSATVYQELDGVVGEDQLNANEDPHLTYLGFGWSLRFLEKWGFFFHKKYGMEIILVRASNIYGPYARFHPTHSNFIPAIIRKAVDKMDPFEVWGSGEVARDVIYSGDFADAVVALMDHEEIKFNFFNVGTGRAVTVGEVVGLALRGVGHTPSEIRYTTDGSATMKCLVLDCSKIKKMIGWEAQLKIENGIQETVNWWRGNSHWWKK